MPDPSVVVEVLMDALRETGQQAVKRYAALDEGVVVKYVEDRNLFAVARYDLSDEDGPREVFTALMPAKTFTSYLIDMQRREDEAQAAIGGTLMDEISEYLATA